MLSFTYGVLSSNITKWILIAVNIYEVLTMYPLLCQALYIYLIEFSQSSNAVDAITTALWLVGLRDSLAYTGSHC